MTKKTTQELNYATRLGRLGESIVQAYLLEWCDFVICSDHITPYDLILDHNNRLYKVQVKTVSKSKTKSGKRYKFQADRPQRSELYYKSRNDLYALVFYPEKICLFKPNIGNQKYFTFSKAPTKEEEFESLQQALEDLNNAPILKPID